MYLLKLLIFIPLLLISINAKLYIGLFINEPLIIKTNKSSQIPDNYTQAYS